MERVTAGGSFTLSMTVPAGQPYSVKVTDARGRNMDASVSESGGTATVTVDQSQWRDGLPGHGWAEVKNTSTNAIAAQERFRIMAGIDADYWDGYS